MTTEELNLFIGIQLIAENAEAVLAQGSVTGEMKMKVNNLHTQCVKIEKDFWDHLPDSAVIEFNNRVREKELT